MTAHWISQKQSCVTSSIEDVFWDALGLETYADMSQTTAAGIQQNLVQSMCMNNIGEVNSGQYLPWFPSSRDSCRHATLDSVIVIELHLHEFGMWVKFITHVCIRPVPSLLGRCKQKQRGLSGLLYRWP